MCFISLKNNAATNDLNEMDRSRCWQGFIESNAKVISSVSEINNNVNEKQ